MTERQDGFLWRIARLHPGWITLIVWFGSFVLGGYMEWLEAVPALAAASFTGFMVFYMGYPLFVLLFVSDRFRSREPARPGRTLAAFFGLELVIVAVIFVGADNMNALTDAANASNVAAILALAVPFLTAATAFFYLIIEAALVLVAAERGKTSRAWHNFAACLQFFYLPFFVFFIHRRIRSLIRDYEKTDPFILDLPMERLTIERMESGHLCLELTEVPGWEDFEGYAEELLRRLGGRVFGRTTTADAHMWQVEIETLPLLLVYEDFPNRVCLESGSYPGDMLLRKLQRRLMPAGMVQEESGPPERRPVA